MPASDEWTEWHLTPRGWDRGTQKEDFRLTERLPSADRVLTSKHRLYLSSSAALVEKSNEDVWRSSDSDVADELLKLYGNSPNHL